jgi:hypothetical protein
MPRHEELLQEFEVNARSGRGVKFLMQQVKRWASQKRAQSRVLQRSGKPTLKASQLSQR